MKKSDVNGDNTNPVYQWLKDEKAGLLGLSRIKVSDLVLMPSCLRFLSCHHLSGTLKSSLSIGLGQSWTVGHRPLPLRRSMKRLPNLYEQLEFRMLDIPSYASFKLACHNNACRCPSWRISETSIRSINGKSSSRCGTYVQSQCSNVHRCDIISWDQRTSRPYSSTRSALN